MTMETPAARPRIALYSHDTMGFGHVRRNILLARALVTPPLHAEVLLISGIREAGAFALPAGADSITLPAYRKNGDGGYAPRSLGGDVKQLVALRACTIRAALRRFAPDVLIVDNVPRGAMGELAEVLSMLRESGRTRCVLGLRDVLDAPEEVRRQWWRQRNYDAARNLYDAVWVYGDAALYDTAGEYGFDADIRNKLRQVGYLDQSVRLGAGSNAGPAFAGHAGEPFVLCVVGSGQDGRALTEAFARATLPAGHSGLILTGSMMAEASRARLEAIAAGRRGLHVIDFVAEPIRLMQRAARIVSMGGYNTVSEILSLGKRALIVPRVKPRREQWIRAERLAAMGLVDMLHPDAASAQALGAWLASSRPAPPPARTRLDFDGLRRVPQLVRQMLREPQAGALRHAAV